MGQYNATSTLVQSSEMSLQTALISSRIIEDFLTIITIYHDDRYLVLLLPSDISIAIS